MTFAKHPSPVPVPVGIVRTRRELIFRFFPMKGFPTTLAVKLAQHRHRYVLYLHIFGNSMSQAQVRITVPWLRHKCSDRLVGVGLGGMPADVHFFAHKGFLDLFGCEAGAISPSRCAVSSDRPQRHVARANPHYMIIALSQVYQQSVWCGFGWYASGKSDASTRLGGMALCSLYPRFFYCSPCLSCAWGGSG